MSAKYECARAARECYAQAAQGLHASETQMKNIRYIVVIALLVGSLLPAEARYYRRAGNVSGLGGDNYHFGYISGGLGYTSLQEEVPDFTPSGDLGGIVGFGYEFRNNGLWVNAGLQLNFHRSNATLEAYKYSCLGYDTQGKEVTLHYTINEQDRQKWQFIEIPILVGWYSHGFYVGAGLKVGYSLNSSIVASGTYELSGTNELYNIEFKNMPEHGYKTYDFEGEYTASLKPMVSLIGEIGYDVLSEVPTRSQLCHVLKVGFYFEYGLNSMVEPVSTNTRLNIDPKNATKAVINPYLAAGMTEKYRVVPFYTGVKITYLVGGSRTARAGGFHKGCNCYN